MKKNYKGDYTGIAKPDKGGKLIAVSYNDVGVYFPCLKVEEGRIIAIGLGGFTESSAFSPIPLDEQKSVLVLVKEE